MWLAWTNSIQIIHPLSAAAIPRRVTKFTRRFSLYFEFIRRVLDLLDGRGNINQ